MKDILRKSIDEFCDEVERYAENIGVTKAKFVVIFRDGSTCTFRYSEEICRITVAGPVV